MGATISFIHDGPEHDAPIKAGYIDEDPHRQIDENPLATRFGSQRAGSLRGETLRIAKQMAHQCLEDNNLQGAGDAHRAKRASH